MFGGRAADHFGQRRMFVAALLLFALASLAGGLAPDRGTLVAARAVQGLGGALMAACSLAIITSSFAPGPQLHRAIGAWAAMNGLGGAAGMLFGGIITQELSWRWVLLINPPIGIAAALVAYAVVSERRRGSGPAAPQLRPRRRADADDRSDGARVRDRRSGPGRLGHVRRARPDRRAASLLLAVFGVIEVRFASEPLIPFKELTKPLRIANNIVLLFSASLFPMWFVSSLYLQQVLYLSPLHTGLIFLPMTLMIMLVASRTGKLVSHFGVRPVLGGGLVMLTAGMLLLAKIGSSGSPIVYIMLPGLLTAAGIAMSIVPSTIAATQGAKEGQAGLASGLVNTSRQIGGGLGLAILVTLATSRSSHLIGAGHGVAQSLTDGFRLAYLIGGGLAARGGARHVHGAAQARRRGAAGGAAPGGRGRRRRRGLRRARHRVRGLARRAGRRVHHPRRLQLRHRADAAPADTAPERHERRRRAGARLHLHDQLLQPQLPAAGRPERAADPRRQPAAGLVPARAGKARRLQPQPADLRRQARARLVAGGRHEHRLDRKRRRRGRQPALPDGREASRHGRLEADAARDR